MAFATRQDLLSRSNAQRLSQLAVPADREMVPLDAIRAAMTGGSTASYTAAEQATVALAMVAVDKALGDAQDLIESYGVANTLVSQALTRAACTLALYYLQLPEGLTEQDKWAYEAVLKFLKDIASGVVTIAGNQTSNGTGNGTGNVTGNITGVVVYTTDKPRYSMTTFDEVGL